MTLTLLAGASQTAASYAHFESDPVRPLAMSPDGTLLFATNISDNRLEVFQITPVGLKYLASVPVGLEPVAVAARSNSEVWVVNHLSDSISIVELSPTPRVTRTLLVGDEPRDIAFAGPSGDHAYVTTARRGQNSPVDPALTVEGTGRALVWIFDAANLGSVAGGTPVEILELFGDTPRALAVNGDGSRVYAAVFHSGNQTVALNEALTVPVIDWIYATFPSEVGQWDLTPTDNHAGVTAPITGRIVQYDEAQSNWFDVNGKPWDVVPFTLPDLDVFEIDASLATPVVTDSYPHVGTILFNLAVNPANGNVFVTNSDANNMVRFEGPGIHGGTTVRGNLHRYRITTIDPGTSSVVPRPLNHHIDYALDPVQTEAQNYKGRSIATPMEMAFDATGTRLWIAAMGSNRVAAIDPAAIEAGTYTPNAADQVEISGGGPAGLVHDAARDRLYVYSRLANSVSVLDVSSHPGTETAVVPLVHNPEPQSVLDGRPLLYDAVHTSSNGEASCSSCHVFARRDELSWDLGNPDGDVLLNNNEQMRFPIPLTPALDPFKPAGFFEEHHPMKGPLLTQDLRGMDDHGPMHWRGDRSAGQFRGDPASTTDEVGAFKEFNVAFNGLNGRTGPVTDQEMQDFADFMLLIPYPPNPIRNLDDTLTAEQEAGRVLFEEFDTASNGTQTCNDCHLRDPVNGKFGSAGMGEFDALTQMFKVPHLRNLYDRIGMFGVFTVDDLGPQIRGAGFSHDGFTSDLFLFVGGEDDSDDLFSFPPGTPAEKIQHKRNLESFLHVFDTNLAPIVGQQVTLGGDGTGETLLSHEALSVGDRIDLLRAQAMVTSPRPACDLIVKGTVGGSPRGWVMQPDGSYRDDADSNVGHAALLALAQAGQELTFTCVYPGGGDRMGIDRDDDGTLDASEVAPIAGMVRILGEADGASPGVSVRILGLTIEVDTGNGESASDVAASLAAAINASAILASLNVSAAALGDSVSISSTYQHGSAPDGGLVLTSADFSGGAPVPGLGPAGLAAFALLLLLASARRLAPGGPGINPLGEATARRRCRP